MLGKMYFFGQGVAKNYIEAMQWYRKAAEQKLPEAQKALTRLEKGWYQERQPKPWTFASAKTVKSINDAESSNSCW